MWQRAKLEGEIMVVKLGILDYAQIDEGSNATQALEETVELAKLADKLGYSRFWMAEHHNVPAFASSSPEMMMMHLANATKNIRLGSGGVMLPHYSPLKVAENFRILEAFHPNRVDLGIGNTVGTTLVNQAMNENKHEKLDYEESITDLTKYLTDNVTENHRFHGLSANPVISTVPEIWLLSMSIRTARIAAKLGVGFTYGFFLGGMDRLEIGVKAVETYRKEFTPSPFMQEPKVSLASFIIPAETKTEAQEYRAALDLWLLGNEQFSQFKEFPSVETARGYDYTDKEKVSVQQNRKRMITGDMDEVTDQLNNLIYPLQADEVLMVPLLPHISLRKKAIELMAEAYL